MRVIECVEGQVDVFTVWRTQDSAVCCALLISALSSSKESAAVITY